MRVYAPKPHQMGHILAALMPQNRLVVTVCMRTGLRVSDVLALRPSVLDNARPTIREAKTGKTRRIYLPKELRDEMRAQSGKFFVFESRTDPRRHRTRQAVYKDIKRAQAFFIRSGALEKDRNLGTHSARKMAAVREYERGGLAAAQKLLNHSDPGITLLYALAENLPDEGRKPKRKKNLKKP